MDRPHFKVANWTEYQHYKDRNPPWIKLHRQIINSEMWVSCDDASRVLAIACMVLAAEFDGCVPANSAYIMRRCYLSHEPNFKPLVDNGFLIDASGLLASCEQDASGLLDQRQRQRQRQSREESEYVHPQASAPSHFDAFWSAYPRKQDKAKARKAFPKAIKKTTIDCMIDAIARQKQTAQWRKGIVPLPTTWLNGERWQDEGGHEGQDSQLASIVNDASWRKAYEEDAA